MKKKPSITVITVCYNSEKTIKETIESVINQTYSNIEYILIDGNSTDNTVKILESYEEEAKEKEISYKWISEPDKGIYDAMNKGIDIASGNWIYFLGSDDIFIDRFVVERVSKKFHNRNTIYYGDVYRPKLNRLYAGEFSKLKLSKQNICHQSIFYPSGELKKIKYNLDYSILADYDLNLKLFKKNKFEYVNLTIANYNDFNGVSKQEEDIYFQENRFKIIGKELGWMYSVYQKLYNKLYSLYRKKRG